MTAAIMVCNYPVAAREVRFNSDIRPIFSQHCLACHGPDEGARQADLRVDTFAEATADLGGFAAIVPGDVEESELFRRITSDDESERMPPEDHGERLAAKEVELIRQWIETGATYETHWAFVKPTKPPVPNSSASVGNEIDWFIKRTLIEQGLQLSRQAKPHRLVRRVSLDLTGLPPGAHAKESPEFAGLVKRFVSEPTSENFGVLVDALQATSAYGEHWASMWLDLARYADSVGYAGDENRTIWPWRDWVISAFNDNMPFDQFTVEQLAGDLLSDPTENQRLATAFHRNTLNNNEGGTNDEEFRTIAVKDRISTTASVWMGLTIRCAECHSHKYDPISQTEYYQFLDFFNQTADKDSNDEQPLMDLFPRGLASEFAEQRAQIAAQEEIVRQQDPVWTSRRPIATASRDGTEFEILDDDSVLAIGEVPDFDEYALTIMLQPGTVTGLRLEVLPDERHGGNVGRDPEGAFIINQVRAETGDGDETQHHKFSAAAADYSQADWGVGNIINDEVVKTKGWAVKHATDGYQIRREAILEFSQPLTVADPTELTFYILQQSELPQQSVGRVRLATTSLPNPVNKYRSQTLDPAGSKLAKLKQQLKPVQVPILEERPADARRVTHVMQRGNFRSPGKPVIAATPTAFHVMPADVPHNRLGVAQWLVSPDNPLTARVTVNRFWARLFGIGLVETEEDFGTQGAAPSHPELLDWLAVDFQQHGWDIKRLLKQIVMSATYRQASTARELSLERDPRNRLLSHGPRFRLSAEVVRDQTLSIAGLLSRRMYGRPVFPPSPIKRIVNAFTGGMDWVESDGEDRYRRAIYTFLKRSQPHPLFATFDMAQRDVCRLRRFRTNTPLQAFMTLNDVAFIEAAGALAARMSDAATAAGQQDIAGGIAEGVTAALARPADKSEIERLTALYEQTLADYAATPQQAAELVGPSAEEKSKQETARLAALTVVANVIFNLDEFLCN